MMAKIANSPKAIPNPKSIFFRVKQMKNTITFISTNVKT